LQIVGDEAISRRGRGGVQAGGAARWVLPARWGFGISDRKAGDRHGIGDAAVWRWRGMCEEAEADCGGDWYVQLAGMGHAAFARYCQKGTLVRHPRIHVCRLGKNRYPNGTVAIATGFPFIQYIDIARYLDPKIAVGTSVIFGIYVVPCRSWRPDRVENQYPTCTGLPSRGPIVVLWDLGV